MRASSAATAERRSSNDRERRRDRLGRHRWCNRHWGCGPGNARQCLPAWLAARNHRRRLYLAAVSARDPALRVEDVHPEDGQGPRRQDRRPERTRRRAGPLAARLDGRQRRRHVQSETYRGTVRGNGRGARSRNGRRRGHGRTRLHGSLAAIQHPDAGRARLGGRRAVPRVIVVHHARLRRQAPEEIAASREPSTRRKSAPTPITPKRPCC